MSEERQEQEETKVKVSNIISFHLCVCVKLILY